MTKLNVLFVCSMNQWRSPTAEAIYRIHLSFHQPFLLLAARCGDRF